MLTEQFQQLVHAQDYQTQEPISLLANTSAFLNMTVTDLNWVGFYLVTAETNLTLGPFQGELACSVIPNDHGVCRIAFKTQTKQNIPNVHDFPGHIACDFKTNSELVIPLTGKKAYGVLDLDSPKLARFDSNLEHELTTLAKALVNELDRLN